MSYLAQRLLIAILLVFLVSFASFAVLMLLPGDPVRLMLGTEAPPHLVEELRAQYGLDRPWLLQYADWLAGAVSGNLGESFIYKMPVTQIIVDRLPMTLSLTIFASLMALLIALPLGIWAAVKRGSWVDGFIQAVVQIWIAIPNFWLGILLLLGFTVMIPLFPPGNFVPISEGLGAHLHSLFLPALTLAIAEAAVLIRMFRASLVEVLNKDFMTFAHTKGLPTRKKYIRYALRNSLIGPITVIGLQVMSLISGVIIIEQIFNLPGLGRLLLIAVQQRDLFLLQGLVIFITVTVILVNLCVDLLYTRIDPRIQLHATKRRTT
ncbi:MULTISPECIES: ABC transporter permease [Paenibacillus]|nr:MULTISPECIES: ABC transporter permease [Paenibacillus]